jgi:hypothetical protein
LPASAAAFQVPEVRADAGDAQHAGFLVEDIGISSAVKPYLFMMNCKIAGSQSPERVPMGTPANGVSPMEVSTHFPSMLAESWSRCPR